MCVVGGCFLVRQSAPTAALNAVVCGLGQSRCFPDEIAIRDWSLITGRGGLQNGKIAGLKLFAPPPQDRVKLFAPPLLKSGNFTRPPYNMAKTSSYRVKSTPKLVVPPPFRMAKTFSAPPFRRGKTSRAPPSRFVAPPSP